MVLCTNRNLRSSRIDYLQGGKKMTNGTKHDITEQEFDNGANARARLVEEIRGLTAEQLDYVLRRITDERACGGPAGASGIIEHLAVAESVEPEE